MAPSPREPGSRQRRRPETMPGGWLWIVVLLIFLAILVMTFGLSAGNVVTVNVSNGGSPLGLGDYMLISKTAGSGGVNGTAPASLTVGGDGVAAGAGGAAGLRTVGRLPSCENATAP